MLPRIRYALRQSRDAEMKDWLVWLDGVKEGFYVTEGLCTGNAELDPIGPLSVYKTRPIEKEVKL